MELLRDIGLGIRSQPWRTALAFLAIALGSLALAVMVAVLGGLAAKSARMLREFGGQVIVLAPAETTVVGPAALTENTATVFAKNLPTALLSAVRRYEAPAQGSGSSVTILATDARLAHIRDWRLVSGRFLDERDVQQRERSAVLSTALAQAWNAHVGDSITLGGTPFRVVGVVACGAAALAGATDSPLIATGERVVFVPLSVTPTWLTQRVEPGTELDAIFVRLPENEPFAAGRARVARLLDDPTLTRAAVAWITPETILRGVRRMQHALDLGIGSITLLSLMLGGITLMSLLVGNVRERVTEIGLRRALGATRRDVAELFVIESCLLTSLAALMGAGAAQWVVRLLAAVPEIPLAVDGCVWLIPLGMALVVGLLASYVPAQMAARISPAAALRAE
ncbi:MAG: ABC transporter permease [Verrucomicrobia bacterium]|nr:MAG: ABC transporter permease [Verrucomicrobiota bacterium]